MKKTVWAALFAMMMSACAGVSTDDGAEPPDPESSTTTEADTTTTGDLPVTDGEACDQLKLALFDLDEQLSSAFADLDTTELEAMSDVAGAALIFEPVVVFYETLAAIADGAPSDVAGDLRALSEWVDPIRESLQTQDAAALDGLEAEVFASSPTSSAAAVDAWAAEHCGISSSVEPEALVSTVLMSAMFAGLGEGLGELADGFDELDQSLAGGDSMVVYGDDPELDGLWDRCQADDDAACDDLYWRTFGVYELFSETCGGRAPFRPSVGGNCESRLATDGPANFGDDPYLDTLWEGCEGGDAYQCDALAGTAPLGSEYEDYGATCAEVFTDSGPRSCSDPEAPFGYGEDADLDALWNGCSSGDQEACSDLWFDSPVGSAYEAMGDACGSLVERGEDCALVADLLRTPVG